MGSQEPQDFTIGKLILRVSPGYGEQVVLTNAIGEEIGTEVVGYDMDGFAVAVRDAFVYLIRQNLPDIEDPSAKVSTDVTYRRALVAPAELSPGMLVEIGDTGAILGQVDETVPELVDGLVVGSFADGRDYSFRPDYGVWARIPN